MMAWPIFLVFLAFGAACAFLLGLAVTLLYLALPRPRALGGFEVDRGED